MFKEKDDVIVLPGKYKGRIEKISTWSKVSKSDSQEPAYYVCVPEWDNGTNGGRWMFASDLQLYRKSN